MSKMRTIIYVCVAAAILTTGILLGILGKNLLADDAPTVVKESLIPLEIVKTFEISALEYRYRNLFVEENIEERKFIFITLESAVKRYAVQYEGAIKMGVNAEDMKVETEEQPDG